MVGCAIERGGQEKEEEKEEKEKKRRRRRRSEMQVYDNIFLIRIEINNCERTSKHIP